MKFLVYAEANGSITIDYGRRDERTGIIGLLKQKPEPISEATSKEDAIEKAYAHLGRNPSDMVYVADLEGRLYEIVISRKYCEERARDGKWHFMAWSILAFCIVCFLATLLAGLGFQGLILFAGVTLLYIAVVQTGIQNEVEAAAVCLIILVLICTLIPGIRAARHKRQDSDSRTNKPMHGSGEIKLIHTGQSLVAAP